MVLGADRTTNMGMVIIVFVVCRRGIEKDRISAWAALPQALAYMMANPHPEKTGYGLVTNGDDILFVKLKRDGSALYDVSRVFALFTSGRELYGVLQVLKRIAGEIVGVGG